MSNGLLTNPKTMLGIAAAVVIMAVAATAGLNSLVSEEDEAPVAVAAVEEPKALDEPVQASGWDNDAGLGDDWGVADQSASGDSGGWGDAAMGVPNASQPTFGSFKPEEPEVIDNGGAGSGDGPPPGADVRGSSSGGRVISGAAPGAPPISAPGGPTG